MSTIDLLPNSTNFGSNFLLEPENSRARKTIRKRPEMAEVERDVEAKRQARKQCEQDAAAAAPAASGPAEGQGQEAGARGPGPRCCRSAAPAGVGAHCGAPAGRDIALDFSQSAPQTAPAPVSKQRSWTAADKAFALEMLPVCGDLSQLSQ